MTHDALRDASPATDDAARARAELEGLFARDQSAVTVVVKKRRLPATPGSAAGTGPQAQAQDAEVFPLSGDTLARGPRVHRLRPSTLRPTVNLPAAPAGAADHGSVGAGALRTRRGRSLRDPSRQPSAVHVVVQAPPRPAAPADEPAWRRILCVTPQEVSYLEVLQALHHVQTLLEQARHARRLQLTPGAG